MTEVPDPVDAASLYPPYSSDALAQERASMELAVGRAIGGWSQLEHALAKGFGKSLGIGEKVARVVFFSQHAFRGKGKLVKDAIDAAELTGVEASRAEVLKAACRKAGVWSEIRNVIAHEQLTVAVLNNRILGGMMAANTMSDGPATPKMFKQVTPKRAIEESYPSFVRLAGIVDQAYTETDEGALASLVDLIGSLPKAPYSERATIEHVVAELGALPKVPHP